MFHGVEMKEFNSAEYMSEADAQYLIEKTTDVLMELQTKRTIIKELKVEIQTLLNSKMELQQEQESVRHEKQFLHLQLEEMRTISKQREDEWSSFRDSWAQNNMKLEVAMKTSDAYKNQVAAQQAEIYRLTAENEDLQKIIRKNTIRRDTNQITKTRVEETIHKLKERSCALEKIQEEILSTSKTAINIANRTDEFRKHYKMLLKNSIEDRERVNKEVVQLTMELANLRLPIKSEVIPNDPTPEKNSFTFNTEKLETQLAEKFEVRLENMSNQMSAYENMKLLQDSEKEAHEMIRRLQILMEESQEKLRKFESKQEKELFDRECQTDFIIAETTSAFMAPNEPAFYNMDEKQLIPNKDETNVNGDPEGNEHDEQLVSTE